MYVRMNNEVNRGRICKRFLTNAVRRTAAIHTHLKASKSQETSGFKKVGCWSPYLTLEVTHKVIIGLWERERDEGLKDSEQMQIDFKPMYTLSTVFQTWIGPLILSKISKLSFILKALSNGSRNCNLS